LRRQINSSPTFKTCDLTRSLMLNLIFPSCYPLIISLSVELLTKLPIECQHEKVCLGGARVLYS
jgi:hypothetical protein